jgi:tetratricopeptide (TPR) repeat protein
VLSAIDVFALADQARAEGRIEDAVVLYDALANDESADIRAEARFRKGMMLADVGRHREAAVTFRALLDEQPSAARVRLELARALALLCDEGSARRELRQAQAMGLPPEVAAAVGQFDQALRSPKVVGGSLEVALAPDSNANRATQARVVDTVVAPLTLSEDARRQSDIGIHLAGQGYARLGIGRDLSFVPRLSGLATLYRDNAFSDSSLSGRLGLEWQSKANRLSPSMGVGLRWYGGSAYARTYGVALDWLHVLGRRSQLVVNAGASRADYLRNDLQDGAIYDLRASVERAFSARLGANLTFEASRQTSRDPFYATMSGGMSVLGWRETGQTTLYASAGARRLEGDAELFLFGARRREWLLSARLGGTFRQLTIHGFAPYGRLSYERNSSSVALYDYDRVATEFGITRAF